MKRNLYDVKRNIKQESQKSFGSRTALLADRAAPGTLMNAFRVFSDAADSLEGSYAQLQAQVERLRDELSAKNADLERSLDENRNMRAYQAHLLEALPCGIVVADSENQLKFANPAARRLLIEGNGVSHPSIIDAKIFARIRSVLADRVCGAEAEVDWEIEPDQCRSISVAQTWLMTPEGDHGDRVYILRDSSEKRRLEQQQEANRRLQALAEMAMVLAHEIRNPLGSLELFAGLLADSTREQPEMRQWVDHLQAGLRSLSATVNNVLQFHSKPNVLRSIHLMQLLKETIEFLEPLAKQKELNIRLTSCHPDLYIAADANRLQQVFFNIFMNAFRVMPRGSAMEARVRWSDENPSSELEISFEDSGPGVAEHLRDKVFDVGYTTTPGSPGLGLAVCKKIVEQHGGTIRVEGEDGAGAIFIISLPIAGAVQ